MSVVRQLVAVLALGAIPVTGVTAQDGRALAVGSFETDGSVGMDQDAYTALGRALGHLLTTELQARFDRAVVVLPLTPASRPGRIDVAAARRAGVSAGAGFLLVGSLLDQYGDIHVEARIIDAASGDPVAVVRGDPALASRAQLGEAMGALADSVNGHAGFTRRAGASPTRRAFPADALVQFGRGLGFEEAGDRAKAAEAFRAAVRAAPGFSEASAALARVGG
jgi:TolB-like protein